MPTQTTTESEHQTPRFRGFVTVSITLSTLLYSIDWTIVVVAFPHMQGIFSATEDQIAWVVTCYVVASAIAMPTAGWASRRYGRKSVMLFATGGFTLASIVCGAADSLSVEVIARTAQGFCGAFIVPLSNSIMLDSYHPKEHGRALSIWSIGAWSGSFMGPVLGGYLTEYLSWRYVFYINIPIGILAFTGILIFFREKKTIAKEKLDWFGFLTLAVGVGAIQIMMDRGHRLDWFDSPEIILEAVVACLGLYLFFTHIMTARQPFLDPRLLQIRQCKIGMILMACYGFLQLPILAIMPMFLEGLIGYPVDLVGLMQMPRGLGLLLALFIAGRLSGKVDPRLLLGTGLAFIAMSNYQMSRWNLDVNEMEIIWTGAFQGIGSGLLILPTQEIAFHGTTSERRTDVSAVINLVRSMASSIGVSITLVIYFMSSGISRSDLVPNVNWFTQSYRHSRPEDLSTQELAQIGLEIDRQASILGYNGMFLFLTMLSIIPFIYLIFIGKLKVGDQKI